MSESRSADDFWPEIVRLSHKEQLRLAKLALKAASLGESAAAYQGTPPLPDEFSTDDDALSWDADGWEEFSASR
jgi:hypothetical protein